ncbi:hypothetical protein R3I94_019863 [Phoxinus phoxinus]
MRAMAVANEGDGNFHKKTKKTEMDKDLLQSSCGVEVSVEETRKASTLKHAGNLVNHSENLPRLTKDMASEVRHILEQDDPNMVISTAFKLCIRQRDLATLEEGSWLNDMVINFYLFLIMKRSNDQQEGLKVYCLSTFFYPKLLSSDGHFAGHAAVKKWTKTVDLFLCDLVLVPLHLGLHWALAVIDFKSQTIQCYDSMGQRHDAICHILLEYLMEENKIKKACCFEASRWTIGRMRTNAIPKQTNGNDCGVFICKYADFLSQGKPLTFRQCDIPVIRKVMMWEIVHQKIL